MGDSGEGLVDSESRIQERMEELRQNRENAKKTVDRNPEATRQLESLKLARLQLVRQLESTTHAARKTQLNAAIADLDHKIAEFDR